MGMDRYMLHIVMSTLVNSPTKRRCICRRKWRDQFLAFKAKLTPADPFTELWLCNPELGLAALSVSLSAWSPEPPAGAHNWPLFKRGSQFWAQLRAPRPRLLLPGDEGVISRLRFGQVCCLGFRPLSFHDIVRSFAFN